ncbi:uncharacterized protein EV422DRAFT_569854 [Fimicolochytrium jonesii]|uniref:uncharacterized protein n=1 Tax=Fimicolochytrium jonesii TaxID=1396493 RepID=UPI0022FF0157|nr:uncharacterized protein EV422DRAFT_569854 [Fimicolochytrium jonesii]KAI8818432.1 hypothetical protein EV422DRAFT_569854 [Fimicolochytrium jonesii]
MEPYAEHEFPSLGSSANITKKLSGSSMDCMAGFKTTGNPATAVKPGLSYAAVARTRRSSEPLQPFEERQRETGMSLPTLSSIKDALPKSTPGSDYSFPGSMEDSAHASIPTIPELDADIRDEGSTHGTTLRPLSKTSSEGENEFSNNHQDDGEGLNADGGAPAALTGRPLSAVNESTHETPINDAALDGHVIIAELLNAQTDPRVAQQSSHHRDQQDALQVGYQELRPVETEEGESAIRGELELVTEELGTVGGAAATVRAEPSESPHLDDQTPTREPLEATEAQPAPTILPETAAKPDIGLRETPDESQDPTPRPTGATNTAAEDYSVCEEPAASVNEGASEFANLAEPGKSQVEEQGEEQPIDNNTTKNFRISGEGAGRVSTGLNETSRLADQEHPPAPNNVIEPESPITALPTNVTEDSFSSANFAGRAADDLDKQTENGTAHTAQAPGPAKGTCLRVLTAHIALTDDELQLDVGDVVDLDLQPASSDEYWWFGTNRSWGENNGRQGFFPASCVEVEKWEPPPVVETAMEEIQSPVEDDTYSLSIEEPAPPERSPMIEESWEPPLNVHRGAQVIARSTFSKTKADELDLSVGDIIVIVDAPEGGWWKGMKNLGSKHAESGWFPSTLVASYVEPVDQLESLQVPSTELEACTEVEGGDQSKRKSWYSLKRLSTKKPQTAGTSTPPSTNSAKKKNRLRSQSAPSPVVATDITEDSSGPMDIGMTLAAVEEASVDTSLASSSNSLPRNSNSLPRNSKTLPGAGNVPDESNLSLNSSSPNKRLSFLLPKGASNRLSMFQASSRALSDSDRFSATAASHTSFNVEDLPASKMDVWQTLVGDAAVLKMSQKEQKRIAAVYELMNTERDYVRDLHIIISFFKRPLVERKIIPSKTVDVIFANVEQLLPVSQELLTALEDLCAVKPTVDEIGGIFLQIMDRLTTYTVYCREQKTSVAKHQSLMQSKGPYRSYLEDMYRQGITRRLDLGGFLIKPVQRICKYPLLIKEILRFTSERSLDFTVLTEALERIQCILNIVNGASGQVENLRKLEDIQQDFVEKILLVSPTRHLLREDMVSVAFGDTKKARVLFLFNDSLLFARKDWRDKYHLMENVLLKDCTVADVRNKSTQAATTLLEFEQKNRDFTRPGLDRFVFLMPSLQAKQAWLEAYRTVCPLGITIQLKEINDAVDIAPVSIDDEDDERHKPARLSGEPDASIEATRTIAALKTQIREEQNRAQLLEVDLAAEKQKVETIEAELTEAKSAITSASVSYDESSRNSHQKAVNLVGQVDALSAQLDELKEITNAQNSRIAELEMTLADRMELVSTLNEEKTTLATANAQQLQQISTGTESIAAKNRQVSDLLAKLLAMDTKLSELQRVENDWTAQVQSLQDQLVNSQAEIARKDVETLELREEIAMMAKKIEQLGNDAAQNDKELRKSLAQCQSDLQDRSDALVAKAAEHSDVAKKLSKADAKVAELQSDLTDARKGLQEAAVRINGAEDARSRERQEFRELTDKYKSLKQSFEHGRAQFESLRATYGKTNARYNALIETNRANRSERDDARKEVARLASQLEALTAQHNGLLRANASQNDMVANLTSKLEQVERERNLAYRKADDASASEARLMREVGVARAIEETLKENVRYLTVQRQSLQVDRLESQTREREAYQKKLRVLMKKNRELRAMRVGIVSQGRALAWQEDGHSRSLPARSSHGTSSTLLSNGSSRRRIADEDGSLSELIRQLVAEKDTWRSEKDGWEAEREQWNTERSEWEAEREHWEAERNAYESILESCTAEHQALLQQFAGFQMSAEAQLRVCHEQHGMKSTKSGSAEDVISVVDRKIRELQMYKMGLGH